MSGREFDRDALFDYVDGRLSPAERERFERSLEADALLRDELRALREVDAALGLLPGHQAPKDFTARVVKAARRRRGILRLVLPLVAAAAAALVAVSLHGSAPQPPKAPEPREEEVCYVWEADVETYGSLALTDLEDQILAELEGS